MGNDQYREYGSSERDGATPGYLRGMLLALSGVRNGGVIVESDDEEHSQEGSADLLNLPTHTSGLIEDAAVPLKMSTDKVTDKNSMKDNSSDSSGRISNSRPNLFHYDNSEAETFVRQTDFREGTTLSVGPHLRPASVFQDRLPFPHEESSGGKIAPGEISLLDEASGVYRM